MSAADTPLTKYHPEVCNETYTHTILTNKKTPIYTNIHYTATFTEFTKSQSPDKQSITDHPLILCRTDTHTTLTHL